MDLIIGGASQGKLSYVCGWYQIADCDISKKVLQDLHLLIRGWMEGGKEPEAELASILVENPELIIICNEIGYGIVPVDRFEREYRERVGRICCFLAGKASRVVRVVCGIGTVIKGEM